MDKTYIQLNVVNTLTILLMASIGVIILGIVASALQTYMPGAQSEVAA